VRFDKKTATYDTQTDTGLGRRLREARQTSQKTSPTTMFTAPLDAEHLPDEPVHPALARRPIAATTAPCGLTLGVSERGAAAAGGE
jgi:hypothetical protein